MVYLVIRGDKCVNEKGSADDGKIKGEKERQEGIESHGWGGGRGAGDRLKWISEGPHLCMCGSGPDDGERS